MEEKLLIGWAQCDLTPPGPVFLQGQFHERISRYVQSPLTVTAMAVDSGEDQAVLVCCDLVGINGELTRRVREIVGARADGLDVQNIVIGATHTHTGPDYRVGETTGLHAANDYLASEKQYRPETPDSVMPRGECLAFLAGRIAGAVEEAWAARRPSFYACRLGRAVVGHCRRIAYSDGRARMYGAADAQDFLSLEGGSDSGIELLYTFGADRTLTGVVVNVACPSQVVEMERFISSDYWGEARKAIREQFGEGVCVLAQCGAAGDQSPRDQVRKTKRLEPDMNSVEGTVEIGRRVARAVAEQYHAAKDSMKGRARFRHCVETVDFPLRRVCEEEYLRAKEEFDRYVAENPKEPYDHNDMAALHIHAGIMDRYHMQKTVSCVPAEIHHIRLGGAAFTTNPFELFLDFGLRIKARCRASQTFVVQLACESAGYLPTEKAERGGHYSAIVASGVTGHEGGDLLVERALKTLNAFFDEKGD